jgi:hypothetical protein
MRESYPASKINEKRPPDGPIHGTYPDTGEGVEMTEIFPEFNVHDTLTIDPGLIRISMAYGYMRAADAVLSFPDGLSRDIAELRVKIWKGFLNHETVISYFGHIALHRRLVLQFYYHASFLANAKSGNLLFYQCNRYRVLRGHIHDTKHRNDEGNGQLLS